MSTPDKLKRQPTANTTPQSTPSFDAIDPEKEMSQRTELMRLKKKSQKL
jgi:hypothetical protein